MDVVAGHPDELGGYAGDDGVGWHVRQDTKKAAIFNGKRDISVEERPKPTLNESTDAIVRVVLACVCGSDLWFYRSVSDLPPGTIGHAFIGVVDETEDDVQGALDR